MATAANPQRTGRPVRIRLATVHKVRIPSRSMPSLLGRPSAAAAGGQSDIAGACKLLEELGRGAALLDLSAPLAIEAERRRTLDPTSTTAGQAATTAPTGRTCL